MKTSFACCHFSAAHSRQGGSATIIFVTLLSIMLVLVAANGRTLVLLKKEVRLIEQRQVQRLQGSPTNAPAAVTLEAKPAAAP
jgi:hypothetical protein